LKKDDLSVISKAPVELVQLMRTILLLTLCLALCLAVTPRHALVSNKPAHRDPSLFRAGEVIVKLKETATALQASDQKHRALSVASLATRISNITQDADPLLNVTTTTRVSDIIKQRGLDRVFVLKFDPTIDIDSVISSIASRDDVEYVEPNYLVKPGILIPNDTQFYNQWSLMNLGVGVDSFPSTLNADIKAYAAWDTTTGSSDVVIALTDTGIDENQPDLIHNIYTNPGEIPGNGIDDDHDGFIDDVHGFNLAEDNTDITDASGHGTEMAGIMAAELNNHIGIAGVSQSKVLVAKFFKRTGPHQQDYEATVADAARALLYSLAAGATIINASWRTLLSVDEVTPEEVRALNDAVNATNDAGALLVCIAGNEGFDNDYSKIYPAAYQLPNQIVVAASDFNDDLWHPPYNPYAIQSGFGKHTVHLAAPGVSVLTTLAHGSCLECSSSDNPDDWYARVEGTSASAAFVSGVAALVKSKYPSDSGILLKRRILEGVELRDTLTQYTITGGRLSADGALSVQLNIVAPVLDRLKYKSGSGKMFAYGSGFQKGATLVVSSKGYSAKLKSEDFNTILARVPQADLPSGVALHVKVRNPDGGESQTLTFTR
jgi:subtilisin family serine protease